MSEYSSQILEKIIRHIIKLLQEQNFRVEFLSFCLLAARQLEYRFIIVVMAGMDFEDVKDKIAKLEQWPSPGRNPCYGIKEIWIPKEDNKHFDIFMYQDGKWLDIWKGERQFNIYKIQELFSHRPKVQPKMARGHIDRNNGCVYFLYAPNNKAIKIGKAANLNKRLKSFQTTLPNAELLATIETPIPYELESDLHRRFARHRIKDEWFEYCDEIKEFIRNHNA